MRGGIRLYFYPRPPRGGRPKFDDQTGLFENISIHALREEGDTNRASKKCGVENFYPRPPRGGRPKTLPRHRRRWRFLSTPSARRATRAASSHELQLSDFYPRPPRGGRRAHARNNVPNLYISIHALREEGDYSLPAANVQRYRFLSTPSARRATTCAVA